MMITGLTLMAIAGLLMVLATMIYLSPSPQIKDAEEKIAWILGIAIACMIFGALILDDTAYFSDGECPPATEIIDTDKGAE